MKGLVEFKDSEGEIRLSCLFGMTAILAYCKHKDIKFNDSEKSLTGDNDLGVQMSNIVSLIYFSVKSYNTFKKTGIELTEEEVSLTLDAYGLLNDDNIKKFQTALYGGFENVEQKKTEAAV